MNERTNKHTTRTTKLEQRSQHSAAVRLRRHASVDIAGALGAILLILLPERRRVLSRSAVVSCARKTAGLGTTLQSTPAPPSHGGDRCNIEVGATKRQVLMKQQ
jgi:hypothetical protein